MNWMLQFELPCLLSMYFKICVMWASVLAIVSLYVTSDGLYLVLSLITISFSILLLFPVEANLYVMCTCNTTYQNAKYRYDEMPSIDTYHFGQDWSFCWSLQSGRQTTRLALLLNKSDCFMKHDKKNREWINYLDLNDFLYK